MSQQSVMVLFLWLTEGLIVEQFCYKLALVLVNLAAMKEEYENEVCLLKEEIIYFLRSIDDKQQGCTWKGLPW